MDDDRRQGAGERFRPRKRPRTTISTASPERRSSCRSRGSRSPEDRLPSSRPNSPKQGPAAARAGRDRERAPPAQREREDASKYAVGRFREGLAVGGRQSAPGARRHAGGGGQGRAHARSARRGRGDRARAVGRVRAARDEAHRPKGRALRPQLPPGDLRGRTARPAGRHGGRGVAARLCAARSAVAPGHGRRRQGRRQARQRRRG